MLNCMIKTNLDQFSDKKLKYFVRQKDLTWFRLKILNEKPGGHVDRAVAAGALDTALWDIYAKAYQKPLWKILTEQFNDNQVDELIFV